MGDLNPPSGGELRKGVADPLSFLFLACHPRLKMKTQPATSNKTMTVTPTAIPAIAPVDIFDPAPPAEGVAVSLGLVVGVLLSLELKVLLVLDADVSVDSVGDAELAAVVKKISLISGSELSLAGTRSPAGQDIEEQGLLAQQPRKGGLLNLQVYHSPVSSAQS